MADKKKPKNEISSRPTKKNPQNRPTKKNPKNRQTKKKPKIIGGHQFYTLLRCILQSSALYTVQAQHTAVQFTYTVHHCTVLYSTVYSVQYAVHT